MGWYWWALLIILLVLFSGFFWKKNNFLSKKRSITRFPRDAEPKNGDVCLDCTTEIRGTVTVSFLKPSEYFPAPTLVEHCAGMTTVHWGDFNERAKAAWECSVAESPVLRKMVCNMCKKTTIF